MKTPTTWQTSNGVALGVHFAAEVITYDPDAAFTAVQHEWYKANVDKMGVLGGVSGWDRFPPRRCPGGTL